MANANPLSKDKNFKERLADKYRLVILNNETFEEVYVNQLSMAGIYSIISTIILVISLFVLGLVFFTPIKRLIPGYGSIEGSPEFHQMREKIEGLEQKMTAQQTYINGFKTMLGNDSLSTSPKQAPTPEQELKTAINNAVSNNARLATTPARSPQLTNNTTIFESKDNSNLANFYFGAPVNGSISAEFAPDDKHFGVDILAKKNTPIKAVSDGFVIVSGWNIETGYTIGVQHSNNIISFYKHNSTLLKFQGDYVRTGEAIAIIGNSGTLSSGPHLHFELWINGIPVNPTDYVNF